MIVSLRRGARMSDPQFKKLIEEGILKLEKLKKTEKMSYTMVFGEIVIKYDFCLN